MIIFNFDTVQHWLSKPKLKVEVLDFYAMRGTAVSTTGPVFDQVSVRLNIAPSVRFHIGLFPVNQIRSVTIEKKSKGYVAFRTEPALPLVVRDEPVVLNLELFAFPVEWARTWNDVEIRLTDRWGNVSLVPLLASPATK